MKILVCGGRDYSDKQRFFAVMDSLEPSCVVHGGAKGADTLAAAWAAYYGIPCMVYRANWDRDGRAAGPIRNKVMLDTKKPDLVVAFPGGNGTLHMKTIARKAKYALMEID